MKEELKSYIQKQIVNGVHILKPKTLNHNGKPLHKRKAYKHVSSYIDNFIEKKGNIKWVCLSGLRGVGKTTVLSQVYLNYHKIYQEDINILYISLDEIKTYFEVGLIDIIKTYEDILATDLEKLDKVTILLIDEVHYDKKWSLTLKSITDRTSKVFILCSGSSAIQLQMNADVERRLINEKLYPLSFREYELIKNKVPYISKFKKKLHDALYSSSNASEVYNKLKLLQKKVNSYWIKVDTREIKLFLNSGSFPFTLEIPSNQTVYQMLNSLINKIIEIDLKELNTFDNDTLSKANKLLYLLAISDISTEISLSNELGISRVTLKNLLVALERADLIIKVQAYGSSDHKKPNKYVFMSSVLRSTLLNITGSEATHNTRQGKLFEDYVASHFFKEFIQKKYGKLYYDSLPTGADFILDLQSFKRIGIEVGLGDKNFDQITNTMDKIKCNYGLVISNNPLTLSEDKQKVQVPIEFFFLM